jgi:hypothetical protein
MVLTACLVLSRANGLFCHRRFTDIGASPPGWARSASAKLDASVAASGPHDLTVRDTRLRQRLRRVLDPSPPKLQRRRKRRSSACWKTAHGPEDPPCVSICAPTLSRPPHPAPHFATIMIRPSVGRDSGLIRPIWILENRNIFPKGAGQRYTGHAAASLICPTGSQAITRSRARGTNSRVVRRGAPA